MWRSSVDVENIFASFTLHLHSQVNMDHLTNTLLREQLVFIRVRRSENIRIKRYVKFRWRHFGVSVGIGIVSSSSKWRESRMIRRNKISLKGEKIVELYVWILWIFMKLWVIRVIKSNDFSSLSNKAVLKFNVYNVVSSKKKINKLGYHSTSTMSCK